MQLFQRTSLFFVLIITIGVFTSCKCTNTDSQQDITNVQNDTVVNDEGPAEKLEKVQAIFYSIPSPMEMASMLKKAGTSYNASMLNDINNVTKYTSSHRQALNLGIYGADLSYASIFNQNQESIIYLSCAKQLADKLDVTTAFNNATMDRMEANVENRDSLLEIVSDSFYTLDAYLKENGRENISAMVITGGWIEGLYLATTIAAEQDEISDELRTRIADQKYSLSDLIELVESYQSSGGLDGVLADLKSLQALYDEVEINQTEETEVSTDESTGMTVIGGGADYKLTDEQIKSITDRVSEIRTSYIQ